MKLDEKICASTFEITNLSTGNISRVDPTDYLNIRQTQMMASNPDMILQFAFFLENLEQQNADREHIEVRASVNCSLNGRSAQPLVDEDLVLTRVTRSWKHYDWILPLAVPLPESTRWQGT
jgi:hypothetical protein